MAKIIFYTTTSLLVVIVLAANHAKCGLTNFFGHSMTKEKFVELLANNDLAPDQVFHLIKKQSHAKDNGELKLNGLGIQDLLDLNHIKMADCDDDIVLERIDQCKQATQAEGIGFASVVNYCKDRVGKLIGFCAQNIFQLFKDCQLDVQTHDLDIIRPLLAKYIHEPQPDFKSLIDEHLAPHQYDWPKEKKHHDLGNSCEHLTEALKPIKVILEYEKEFDIKHTENEQVSNWMKAYKMCEFYFANY